MVNLRFVDNLLRHLAEESRTRLFWAQQLDTEESAHRTCLRRAYLHFSCTFIFFVNLMVFFFFSSFIIWNKGQDNWIAYISLDHVVVLYAFIQNSNVLICLQSTLAKTQLSKRRLDVLSSTETWHKIYLLETYYLLACVSVPHFNDLLLVRISERNDNTTLEPWKERKVKRNSVKNCFCKNCKCY